MNFKLLNLQYLKEKLSVDLEIGKTDFIKKFKTLIVDDEGYLVDGFFTSKKDYIGKVQR